MNNKFGKVVKYNRLKGDLSYIDICEKCRYHEKANGNVDRRKIEECAYCLEKLDNMEYFE